jgi:hypothetical protein
MIGVCGPGGAFAGVELDQQHGACGACGRRIAYKDILNHAAAHGGVFKAKSAAQRGALEVAIFDKHLPAVVGDFASGDHAAVAIFMVQPRMTIFSEGTSSRRPSLLRPDLIAMQSSPVSNTHPSMSTSREDSRSQPSLLGPWEETVTPRTVTFTQSVG